MRHHRLRLACVFMAILSVLLTYGFYAQPFGNRFNTGGLRAPSNGLKQEAYEAEANLNASLRSPVENSNLAAMGDRIAAFAKLSGVLMQHSSLDRKPLLDSLSYQFPWWKLNAAGYIPWSPSPTAETGLVMCVGSKNFVLAAHLVRTLRNVINSSLPIEIAYAGDNDLPPSRQADLKELDSNIETVNLLDYFDDNSAGLQTGGYAMKPFAALASRFRKVILVDADVLFLRRPDELFDEYPDLQDTGTLFWHDRAYVDAGDFSRRDWIRKLLNGRQPSALLNQSIFWQEDLWQEMDSGVVCFDKSKSTAFMGLVFATWMNTKEIREGIVYKAVLGDKETYWLAHELASFPYSYVTSSYAGVLGSVDPSATTTPSSRTICSVQILHVDGKRNPFWFNGSLRNNKSNKKSKDFGTFSHWIEGTNTWQTMPKWRFGGGNSWCAEGEVKSGTDIEPIITAMISEAKAVDTIFPDT